MSFTTKTSMCFSYKLQGPHNYSSRIIYYELHYKCTHVLLGPDRGIQFHYTSTIKLPGPHNYSSRIINNELYY